MEFTDKIDFTEGTKLTWPLKILFFFGGLITMSSMLGFFALLFTNADECFISCFGICMTAGAIYMTRVIDNEKLILSVASPLCLIGHFLINIGFFKIDNVEVIIFLNILVLAIAWIFCRNHLMRQIFLLAIFALIPLVFIDLKHITHSIFIHYIFFFYAVILLAVYGLTIMYDADKFDKENIYAQYIPTIRFCTVVTAIGYARASAMIGYIDTVLGSDLFSFNGIVGSIICATFTFVVAYKLLSKQVKDTQKFTWSIALIFLGCVASCISPEMALATLGLVLTYTVLDYFGVVICGLFMIYALTMFYYDLNITLIYKSYLLMASGIVFLSLFYFIKKLAK